MLQDEDKPGRILALNKTPQGYDKNSVPEIIRAIRKLTAKPLSGFSGSYEAEWLQVPEHTLEDN